jgi:hypothetical protein
MRALDSLGTSDVRPLPSDAERERRRGTDESARFARLSLRSALPSLGAPLGTPHRSAPPSLGAPLPNPDPRRYDVKVKASEYAKYYFLLRSMLMKSGLGGDHIESLQPLDIDGAKKIEMISEEYVRRAYWRRGGEREENLLLKRPLVLGRIRSSPPPPESR